MDRLRSGGITLLFFGAAGLLVSCGSSSEPASEAPEDVQALLQTTSYEPSGALVATDTATPMVTSTTEEKVSGRARYSKALSFHAAKDERAAIREIEKVTEEYPKYVDAWQLKGVCHLALGEDDKAIEAFEKVLEVDPKSGEGLRGIGLAYQAKGQSDKAAEVLRRAVEADPSAINHARLGTALAAGGDLEGAQVELEAAIKAQPENVAYRRDLGDALLAQGKHADAQKQYEEALKLTPNDDELRFNYGLCLEQGGKVAEAIVSYKQAIAINGKNADAYLNLGLAYAGQSDSYAAIEALEGFLRLRPEDPKAPQVRDQIEILRGGGEKTS